MYRITIALATVLSLAFTQVTAQDFDKGIEAYNAGDYATAHNEWKPLAEQGNAKAQYKLGIMHYSGKGVPQDYAEAVKWFRLSAEQGNAGAQHNLGYMYDTFRYDYAEALKWYRLAAEQGYARAQNNIGNMYLFGTGVLQDNVTAHMWFIIASANGSKKAGDSRDQRAALNTASEITKATAMAKECMKSKYKKCGYLPAFTQVTSQDFDKGIEAYKAGDYATALQEFKPLAEQGNAKAQYFLGGMYVNGNGVPQDATEAVKWFRLSAEQGNAGAQAFLGTLYEFGNGVLQDYAEAIKWFRLSAVQGNATAQYFLGDMYENGTNNLTAHMWYIIASANGYEDAGAKRDELAALMTASEITRATAMAKKCMNSNYKKCGW
jgi:uncharacterized protein